jgi:hypothetical protein
MNDEQPVVTPAQAAHAEELRQHRNGALNRAKPIPESAEKVLGPWLVPAPEQGPGQKRYSSQPVMTQQERAALEPPEITDGDRQRASNDAARQTHYDALNHRDAGGREKGGGISQD